MLAPPQESSSLRPLAARFAITLAAFAAMRSYAAFELQPSATAEGSFLALVTMALLFALALLPGPAYELGAGALLATAAVWSLPPGPARGAAVSALLVATLAVAALRRLPAASRRQGLPFTLTLALSLGAQILLRGHLLFAPERTPKTLFALFGLPLAGALAVWWTARRHGVAPAVTAAALTLLLAPGWNVSSTLGWLGLVAGEALVRKESPRWARGAALLLALAVAARAGLPGIAFLICGGTLAAPIAGCGAALLASLALAWPLGSEGLAAILPRAFWCLALVPSLPLPRRELWPAALAALLLAIALPLAPNPGVLAAPIALAVLASSTRPGVALPRLVWTSALFLAVALLASYPWLRPTPLPLALGWFGLSPGWRSLLLLGVTVGGLALLGAWIERSGEHRRFAPRLAGASAALALLAACAQLPRPGVALMTPEVPVVLDAESPSWEGSFRSAGLRRLVLETSLSNAATLPRQTPVAAVRLYDAGGTERGWVLRAGVDSGEWAAQRPDVLSGATLDSPSPWVSWIADGFFAQRYRCRREIPPGFLPVKVVVERSPELPLEVALALHQIEVAP